jgi:hypothetical protein
MSSNNFMMGASQPFPKAIDPTRTETSSMLVDAKNGQAIETPIVTAFLVNSKPLFEAASSANVSLAGTPLEKMARDRDNDHRQFEISAAEIAALPDEQRGLVESNRLMVEARVAEVAKQNLIANHKVSRAWKSPRTGEYRIVTWTNVTLGRTLALLTGVLGAGLYFFWGRKEDGFGHPVGNNPWHANSLEWYATSPPWHENFHETPMVHRGPYEFSSPVAHHAGRSDYLMQTDALPEGVDEPSGH